MINFNLICLFIVLNLKYIMYKFHMATVVYVKFIVVMYVSMYSDMFYILWPAGQIGSIEFEFEFEVKWILKA
jgi:hypothetical protein